MINATDSILLCGTLISGDKVKNGSTFHFIGANTNYPSTGIAGTGSILYDLKIKHIPLLTGVGFNGYWGGGFGKFSNQTIIDLDTEGFRQLDLSEYTDVIIGATARGTGSGDNKVEPTGAIIKSARFFGGQYAIRTLTSRNNTYIHECDMAGATLNPINNWQSTNISGFVFRAVDCNFGAFADASKVNWSIPSTVLYTNPSTYEAYSALIRVLDSSGNAISGATVTLTDTFGTQVFSYTTNTDGYCGEDSGTMTTATSSTVTDTSKSWTTDQWWFKELFVTSGSGAEQRRIIKKGNTATVLTMAWNFVITPATNDRYIMIPYVDVKKFVPAAFTPNSTQSSTVTTYSPFTLKVSKSGYRTHTKKFSITKRIDESITLDKATTFNISTGKIEYSLTNKVVMNLT
jgi:hypothetical protein